MLISYSHLYPRFGVRGKTFTGERGGLPTRGYDQLGTAGERQGRRIKLRFQAFRTVERDSLQAESHSAFY